MSDVAGPILLMGVGTRPLNLPMNHVPFRQDSSFLYYTGCSAPGAALWLEDGKSTLFLPKPTEDDPLWHGPTPSLEERGAALGVDRVLPAADLDAHVAGRSFQALSVGDLSVNQRLERWSGRRYTFGRDFGDPELVKAVIAHRRIKSSEEMASMRAIGAASARAHELAMAATQPGRHERHVLAVFEAALQSRGLRPGYSTILSQRGEILHNHDHSLSLEAGQLLLLDGGGELPSGYCADITRTWPVSGTFSGRQRSAYQAVLRAQEAAIAACRAGNPYRAVHDAASREIAEFMVEEGLAKVSVDTILERHAHALFFPHGVGHHLGMDVHDLENFGDLPSYPEGVSRPEPFGTRYLRLNLPIEAGWVVTVEPGFYVAPAIIRHPDLVARFADIVDFEEADRWIGFGGIRIEDDIAIHADGPENLTAGAPKRVADVEATVGRGLRVEDLWS